jgi:hypothetical protein
VAEIPPPADGLELLGVGVFPTLAGVHGSLGLRSDGGRINGKSRRFDGGLIDRKAGRFLGRSRSALSGEGVEQWSQVADAAGPAGAVPPGFRVVGIDGKGVGRGDAEVGQPIVPLQGRPLPPDRERGQGTP